MPRQLNVVWVSNPLPLKWDVTTFSSCEVSFCGSSTSRRVTPQLGKSRLLACIQAPSRAGAKPKRSGTANCKSIGARPRQGPNRSCRRVPWNGGTSASVPGRRTLTRSKSTITHTGAYCSARASDCLKCCRPRTPSPSAKSTVATLPHNNVPSRPRPLEPRAQRHPPPLALWVDWLPSGTANRSATMLFFCTTRAD